MDRRPRTCKRRSNSSIITWNTHENVSDCTSSSREESDDDLSLEVQIAESLERMISSPGKYNSALLDVKLLRKGPNDKSAPRILLDKIDLPVRFKHRKKLLEECKLKLKGNTSSNQSVGSSMSVHRSIPKKCEDRHYPRRKSPHKQEKRDICVNSAPLTHTKQFDCLTGKSNFITRSVETIKDGHCGLDDRRPRNDKRGREMGDFKPTRTVHQDESTATSSDERLFYKPKLEDQKEVEVGDTSRQVYTTARTYNIRELLKCQNSKRHKQNPKEPCFCQHCGMVDVLLESQKRLVTDEACNPPEPEPKKPEVTSKTRKELSGRRSNVNTRVVSDLCEKLKTLETVLQQQEDKFVTKEYLKVVVDKIISYMSRQERSKKTTPLIKNTATQCSKTFLKRDVATLKITSLKRRQNDRFVATALTTTTNPYKRAAVSDKETLVSCHSTDCSSACVSNTKKDRADVFYKWGDEIIQPGFDLKGKITQLIGETFNGLKANKTSNDSKKIETNAESSSEKTLYLCGSENQVDAPVETKSSKRCLHNGIDFKRVLDIMSEKIYTDYISDQKKKNSQANEHTRFSRDVKKAVNDEVFKKNIENARKKAEALLKQEFEEAKEIKNNRVVESDFKEGNPKKVPSQKALKRSLIPKYKKKDGANRSSEANSASRVHVTYMSPKAESWKKDSCVCFRVEQHFRRFINNGCKGQISKADKMNFLRKIAASKNSNDVKLWNSIWTEAKAPGMLKDDKLAVQIPEVLCPKGRAAIKELEFTVAEIEDIANHLSTKH